MMHRRDFLAVSAGGLTLAFSFPSLSITRLAVGSDASLISAHRVLSIADNGKVTFVSPYTEMGQGSPTAAAQIIADALHTNLDEMDVVHPDGTEAQSSETYRNLFNGGGSGGSQSMATAWPALNEIGATARTLLIAAAAESWGVSVADCRTEPDRVVCGTRSLGYGELASAAAELPVPTELTYRPASEFRYVGKNRPRADLAEVLTGRAPYAIDAAMENMLYAGLERCPTCGGTPDVLNRDEVLSIDGVVDVFALDAHAHTENAKPAIVVVGIDTWSVLNGRRALKIDWQPAAASFADEDDFWKSMSRTLESGKANNEQAVGDFDAMDTASMREVSAEYRTPHQNQAMMEPLAMVAWRTDDHLKMIISTQYPGSVRDKIAELTGLGQDAIEIENRIMGGSFGRRFSPDCLTETVLVAERLRKPVKLMWTREDDTRHGQYRNASLSRITATIDGDNRLRRWQHQAVQTHPSDPSKVQAMEYGMNDTPYRFDAARYEIFGLTGDVNLGAMRSPPHPLKSFAVTSFLDELAHQQGRDPIDLHIELIGAPRELPMPEWLANHGHTDNTGRHIELAHRVREMSDWDTPPPAGTGRGFSSGFIFGTHIAMVVTVAWRDERIHIERADCAVHCGRVINPDSARAQVEGGLIYGLSSAMGEAITTSEGAVVEGNFDRYPLLRFSQAPIINVDFVASDERPSGLGEPPTPPAYAALANAIFAASGKRIREIPLNRHIRFA
jgi:CO/xanthine dehydrogenase Mo-binding subunit